MVREVIIIPVLNGFVVRVGCQQVVFNSPEQLGDNIRDYYKNPEAVEKKFVAGAVNKTMEQPPLTVGEDRPRSIVREPRPLAEALERPADPEPQQQAGLRR